MGIHYFYTWLTTRYPIVTQPYNPERTPQIDYLYLDLNGVFYKCSQDKTGVFRELLKGKEIGLIYIEIVNYINFIVKTIKPKKQLFIALDGVAPRAKMNDQRNRRYKSFKESLEEKQFLFDYLKLDKSLIDKSSISISPGSPFMTKLNEHLDFFIKRKIKEDLLWKNIKVIYSGGNVPGEGEHKILDYVRDLKEQSDFDINSTHCFYGNDSDLVILALATHLPFVMILREEQEQYQRKVISQINNRREGEQKMIVLYVNILKEYFELEFQDCFQENFDIEKFVDDFVFFSFLIGNDFLHQTFCMNTRLGNFDIFIKVLKKFYEKKQSYLVNEYQINQESLLQIFKYLKEYEDILIQTTLIDFKKKLQELRNIPIYQQVILGKGFKNPIEGIDYSMAIFDDKFLTIEDFLQFVNKSEDENDIIDQNFDNQDEEIENKNDETFIQDQHLSNFELCFKQKFVKIFKTKKMLEKILQAKKSNQNYKSIYYSHFMDIENDQEKIDICYQYLHGCDFILRYYYLGCPSWTWYYPYEMAPLLSDLYNYLKSLKENQIELNFQYKQGKPSNPFVHQLCILPKSRLKVLPQNIQEVLEKNQDIMQQIYPNDFELLPFDRIKEYTWHAKIPKVQMKQIDKFIEEIDWNDMKDDAKKRNEIGELIVYQRDENCSVNIKPSLPGFQDEQGPIKIEFQQKDFNCKQSTIKLPFDQIKSNIFPSIKIFKNIEIKKVKKRQREIVYLFLSSKNIKKYWEKLYLTFKSLKENKMSFPWRLYADPIFNRLFLSYEAEKVNREKFEQQDIQRLIKNLYEEYYQFGIILEDQCNLESLKFFFIFHVEIPVFQNISFNMGNPTLNLKTIENKKFKSFIFLKTTMKKQYPSLLEFEKSVDEKFKDNQICVDLFRGDLVYIEKLNWNNQTHKGKILKQNNLTKNFGFANLQEKLILLTPKILLTEFRLDYDNRDVLFVVLDNFVILTNPKNSSTLKLGDGFQMGLEFMKILNQKKEKFLSVNEYLKILPYKQIKEKQLPPMYQVYDEITQKNLKFHFFFTKEGINKVKNYFEQFPEVINYLKIQSQQKQLSFEENDNFTKFKTMFKVQDIFKRTTECPDINIPLFNKYVYFLKKSDTRFKLRSCMSTLYDKQVVDKILQQNFKNKERNQVQTHSSFLVKYDQYKINILPKMLFQPQYHKLSDRVVFINNSDKHLNFGQTGTIVGIYKDKIEVVWDEPFIGGTNLEGKCPHFRGSMNRFFDLFNLSQWSKIVIKQDHIKEFEKCWEGDYDIKGLFDMARYEEKRVYNDQRYTLNFESQLKTYQIILFEIILLTIFQSTQKKIIFQIFFQFLKTIPKFAKIVLI